MVFVSSDETEEYMKSLIAYKTIYEKLMKEKIENETVYDG
jgi:hypothetical protein